MYANKISIVLKGLLLASLFWLTGCKNTEEELPEQPPVIVVGGDNPLKTGIYLSFVDDTIRISDRFGIDTFWMEHNIDTSLLGYYQISYHAKALSGMTSEAQRDVWVVVKPQSMTGLWNVFIDFPFRDTTFTFIDSLCAENENIIINNFLASFLPDEKIELSLAADLQNSVYIAEQYFSDSLYYIFGDGTIDERALQMTLSGFVVEDNDTILWNAIYSKDSVSIK